MHRISVNMSDVNNLWTCLINLLKANLCGLINFGGQFGDLGGGEETLRSLIHRLRTNTKPNGLKRVLLNVNFGFYPADKDQIPFFFAILILLRFTVGKVDFENGCHIHVIFRG